MPPATKQKKTAGLSNAEKSSFFARREAAKVLTSVLDGDARRQAVGSIKALVFKPSVRNKKATFALVCQTLKCLPYIKEILESSVILNSKWKKQEALMYLITYDILFGQVQMDDLVPDLLVLPPGIDLHDHHLVKDGSVLRQVLDACSAPRNKTVHLAALMRGEGKIIAYELDNEKVKWKECTIKQDGSTNVEVLHEDFLKLSPVDLSYSKDKVIGILDWDLSTLGNQMFDVAYSTLHYYAKFQL